MSLIDIFCVLLITLFYVTPTFILVLYSIRRILNGDTEEFSRIFIFFMILLSFVPILNIFLIVGSFFTDELQEKIELYLKRKEELKERNRKIKLGIIKLTESDPFGEETN